MAGRHIIVAFQKKNGRINKYILPEGEVAVIEVDKDSTSKSLLEGEYVDLGALVDSLDEMLREIKNESSVRSSTRGMTLEQARKFERKIETIENFVPKFGHKLLDKELEEIFRSNVHK